METVREREQLQGLRTAVQQSRGRQRRLKVLVKGRKSDFWAALKQEIQLTITAQEEGDRRLLSRRIPTLPSEMSVPQNSTPEQEWGQLKMNQGVKNGMNWIHSEVEKAEAETEIEDGRIEQASQKIKDIETAISSRRESGKGKRTARQEV